MLTYVWGLVAIAASSHPLHADRKMMVAALQVKGEPSYFLSTMYTVEGSLSSSSKAETEDALRHPNLQSSFFQLFASGDLAKFANTSLAI